jgi:enterochelin esterase family protein
VLPRVEKNCRVKLTKDPEGRAAMGNSSGGSAALIMAWFRNGLALCVLHHKTFDFGAFTVREGVRLVSDQADGTTGFQEALMDDHGKPIRDPQHPDWGPEPKHLDWHGREVFKGAARHRA